MSADEIKIRRAFKEKNWNAIKTSDSWQIFKIMSEFVEGFEKMSKIGPCVSVFGSARTKSDLKKWLNLFFFHKVSVKKGINGWSIFKILANINDEKFFASSISRLFCELNIGFKNSRYQSQYECQTNL